MRSIAVLPSNAKRCRSPKQRAALPHYASCGRNAPCQSLSWHAAHQWCLHAAHRPVDQTSGHLPQGRFKTILVEKESYLLELVRYVVLNPARANMVGSEEDWKWSSYCATAELVDIPSFLTTEWILSQFDRDQSRAQKAYRRFVRQGRGIEIWTDLRHGYLLGSEAFDEQVEPLVGERHTESEISRTERLTGRASLDELFVDAHDKSSRNECIHQAMRIHEYTLKEIVSFTGLHYSTISVIAKRVSQDKHPK